MHTTESSETFIHRVKVLNLPKHELASIKQFFKLHNLHKFKKAPMWEYAYLNFEVCFFIWFSFVILIKDRQQKKQK